MSSMTETCPSCGESAAGRFCAHCGVVLSADCRECGNSIPRGGRFCNQCGTASAPAAAPQAGEPAAAPAGGGAGKLPWAIAGAAVVALAAVLLLPRLREEPAAPAAFSPAAPAAGPAMGAGGDPRAVDLASMTPREAADRLFNRVMQSVSSGDSAEAQAFLPMAISAYERVPELDADGHYHLAVLQMVRGDHRAARAEADAILETSPSHLFGLFTAAQAERELGNEAEATAFFRRFRDAYEAETARQLPEYGEHAPALAAMKSEAESAAR